jgi:TonB family protein
MSLVSMILILSTFLQGMSEDKACNNHPQQLLDKNKVAVRLSAKETKKRVVNREVPKLPGLLDAQGTVVVEVLINPEGKVDCARALTGHPILKKRAEETVRKWTFKPVEVEHKPVAVYGLITMQMHWDAEEAKKTCQQ